MPSYNKDAEIIKKWFKSKGVSSSIYGVVIKKIESNSSTITIVKDYSVIYIHLKGCSTELGRHFQQMKIPYQQQIKGAVHLIQFL